jgi:hypothetical protein
MKTLPVVFSPADVVQLLESVKVPTQRVILTTCDAAGLLVSEAVHLTIPAIDRQRVVLRVAQRQGAEGSRRDALPEAARHAAGVVAAAAAMGAAQTISQPARNSRADDFGSGGAWARAHLATVLHR